MLNNIDNINESKVDWWIPVLLYHRVNTQRDPLNLAIDPNRFERQLRLLKKLGYRSLAMAELAESIESGRKPSGKRIVITFDDGYLDFYTNAWPLLEKYGFGATVYLVSDYIGGDSSFDKGLPSGVGPWKLMDYSQIVELQRSGIEFGSHGCQHRALDTLDDTEKHDEVVRSRQELEQKLGQPITAFSYPYAKFQSSDFNLLSEAGYRTAVSGYENFFQPLAISRLDLTALPMRAIPMEISPFFRVRRNKPLYKKLKSLMLKF